MKPRNRILIVSLIVLITFNLCIVPALADTWVPSVAFVPRGDGVHIEGARGESLDLKIKTKVHQEQGGGVDPKLSEEIDFAPGQVMRENNALRKTVRLETEALYFDFFQLRFSNNVKFDIGSLGYDVEVRIQVQGGESTGYLTWADGRLSLDLSDLESEGAQGIVVKENSVSFTIPAGTVLDPLVKYDEDAGTYQWGADLGDYAPAVVIPATYTDNVTLHVPDLYDSNSSVLYDYLLMQYGDYLISGDMVQFEFILENLRPETDPSLTDKQTSGDGSEYVIWDDDPSAFTAIGPINVTIDASTKLTGNSSLRIDKYTVDAGFYLTDTFVANLGAVDFFSFAYKGNNTGDTMFIQLRTPDHNNMGTFTWIDTGSDWRVYKVPIRNMVITGTFDLTPATTMYVSWNAGVSNKTVWFDRIILDSHIWTPFEVYVPDNTLNMTVYSLDSSGLDPQPVFTYDFNGSLESGVYFGNQRNLEDEYIGTIAKTDLTEALRYTINMTLLSGDYADKRLNVTAFTQVDLTKMGLSADYATDKMKTWNTEYARSYGNPWSGVPNWQWYFGVVGNTFVNSGTDVWVSPPNAYAASYTTSNGVVSASNWAHNVETNVYSFEAIVDNDREESNATLTDGETDAGIEHVIYDDADDFWTVGTINVTLTVDAVNQEKGVNATIITRIPTLGTQTLVIHDYGVTDPDWTGYEYISVWFEGNNSNNQVYLKIMDNSVNATSYYWTDDYDGWKRHTFALQDPDILQTADTVNQVLDAVDKIAISMSTDTEGVEVSVDRITLDAGQWVRLEFTIPDEVLISDALWGGTTILKTWSGSSWATAIYGNGNVEAGGIYFLDGTVVSDVMGVGVNTGVGGAWYNVSQRGQVIAPITSGSGGDVNAGSITYSSRYGTVDRTGIALKMAPADSFDSAIDGISQIKIQLTIEYEGAGLATYEFEDSSSQYYGLDLIDNQVVLFFDPNVAQPSPYVALINEGEFTDLFIQADENGSITWMEFTPEPGKEYTVLTGVADCSATVTAPTGETISELIDRWGYLGNTAQFVRGERRDYSLGIGSDGFGMNVSDYAGLKYRVDMKTPLAPWDGWTADEDSGRSQARYRVEIYVAPDDRYSYEADLNVPAEAAFLTSLFLDVNPGSINPRPDAPAKNTTITPIWYGKLLNITYVDDILSSAEARRYIRYLEINGSITASMVIPTGYLTGNESRVDIIAPLGYPRYPVTYGLNGCNLTSSTWNADLETLRIVTAKAGGGSGLIYVYSSVPPANVVGEQWYAYDPATNLVTIQAIHSSPNTVTIFFNQAGMNWASSSMDNLQFAGMAIFLTIALMTIGLITGTVSVNVVIPIIMGLGSAGVIMLVIGQIILRLW